MSDIKCRLSGKPLLLPLSHAAPYQPTLHRGCSCRSLAGAPGLLTRSLHHLQTSRPPTGAKRWRPSVLCTHARILLARTLTLSSLFAHVKTAD